MDDSHCSFSLRNILCVRNGSGDSSVWGHSGCGGADSVTRTVVGTSDKLAINPRESTVALALSWQFTITSLAAVIMTNGNITEVTAPAFETSSGASMTDESRIAFAGSQIAYTVFATVLARWNLHAQHLTRQPPSVVSSEGPEPAIVSEN